MMNLSSRGWGKAAAILCLIPCFVVCCWGLPIGIWALMALNNPDVIAAFNANSGRADRRDEGWSETDRG
jgi:hypothetical protein